MVSGRFAESVSPNSISPKPFRRIPFRRSRFAERTFRRTDVSPNGHFAEWTFRRTDVSPKGRFAESISPKGNFGQSYHNVGRKIFGETSGYRPKQEQTYILHNAYDRSINDAKRKINDFIKFKIPTQTM